MTKKQKIKLAPRMPKVQTPKVRSTPPKVRPPRPGQ